MWPSIAAAPSVRPAVRSARSRRSTAVAPNPDRGRHRAGDRPPVRVRVHVRLLINTIGLPSWVGERAPLHRGVLRRPRRPAVVVVLGGLAVQYRYGPRTVVRSVGGRRVSADEYPELHAAVTRLAAQTDVPKPDVAVARTDLPNAFAVGRRERHRRGHDRAVGDARRRRARRGVGPRACTPQNRDASLMTVAWVLPTVTYYLAALAFYVLYGLFKLLSFGGGSGGDRDGRALAVGIVVITVSALVTLTVSAMFWCGSVLIHRVLSRYREYAADRRPPDHRVAGGARERARRPRRVDAGGARPRSPRVRRRRGGAVRRALREPRVRRQGTREYRRVPGDAPADARADRAAPRAGG